MSTSTSASQQGQQQDQILDDTSYYVNYSPESSWQMILNVSYPHAHGGTIHQGYIVAKASLRFYGKRVSVYLIPQDGTGWNWSLDNKSGGPFYVGPPRQYHPVSTDNITIEAEERGDHTFVVSNTNFQEPDGSTSFAKLLVDYFAIDGTPLRLDATAEEVAAVARSYTPSEPPSTIKIVPLLVIPLFLFFLCLLIFLFRRQKRRAAKRLKIEQPEHVEREKADDIFDASLPPFHSADPPLSEKARRQIQWEREHSNARQAYQAMFPDNEASSSSAGGTEERLTAGSQRRTLPSDSLSTGLSPTATRSSFPTTLAPASFPGSLLPPSEVEHDESRVQAMTEPPSRTGADEKAAFTGAQLLSPPSSFTSRSGSSSNAGISAESSSYSTPIASEVEDSERRRPTEVMRELQRLREEAVALREVHLRRSGRGGATNLGSELDFEPPPEYDGGRSEANNDHT